MILYALSTILAAAIKLCGENDDQTSTTDQVAKNRLYTYKGNATDPKKAIIDCTQGLSQASPEAFHLGFSTIMRSFSKLH